MQLLIGESSELLQDGRSLGDELHVSVLNTIVDLREKDSSDTECSNVESTNHLDIVTRARTADIRRARSAVSLSRHLCDNRL